MSFQNRNVESEKVITNYKTNDWRRNLPRGTFESIQLVGEKGGLPAGRAANLVSLLGGAVTLKLSSAAVPYPGNNTAVEIGPPFYLELLLPFGVTIPLQKETSTESDESTVLGNQTNEYAQLFFEKSGRSGDLRISKIVSGDPTIVGNVFVHERMAD